MNLNEAIETLELLEARRHSWAQFKTNLGDMGARFTKYGPYGIKVVNRGFGGLKQSIEKAGGRFKLKRDGKRQVGTLNYNGHDFNVSVSPDYSGEEIVFSDGSL